MHRSRTLLLAALAATGAAALPAVAQAAPITLSDAQVVTAAGGQAGPYDVAAAELNGDGFPDLVTANLDDHSVSVLLGSATGAFTEAPGSPYPAPGAWDVEVGDVTSDGRDDVVVHVEHGGWDSAMTLTSDGAGGLTQVGAPVHLSAYLHDLALADVDGDGKPDLAGTDAGSGEIELRRGDGAGGWATFPGGTVDVTPTGFNGQPSAVELADLDGDADLDMVVGHMNTSGAPAVRVHWNQGGSWATGPIFSANNNVADVELADVDGDGLTDILATSAGAPGATEVLVWRATAPGTFPNEAVELPAADQAGIEAADFDNDDRLDLAHGLDPWPGFTMTVRRFVGGNGLFQTSSLPERPIVAWARAVVGVDVDDDGRRDVVSSARDADGVSIIRNLTDVPTVSHGTASAITGSGATVAATVNPNGGSVTTRLELVGGGQTILTVPQPEAGTTARTVTIAATGLAPDTTYRFRVIAQREQAATTRGAWRTLTTAPAGSGGGGGDEQPAPGGEPTTPGDEQPAPAGGSDGGGAGVPAGSGDVPAQAGGGAAVAGPAPATPPVSTPPAASLADRAAPQLRALAHRCAQKLTRRACARLRATPRR